MVNFIRTKPWTIYPKPGVFGYYDTISKSVVKVTYDMSLRSPLTAILSELESDRNLFRPKYSAEYLTEYSAETE